MTRGGVTIGGTPAPWVLVAGGFHREGGMDKLNAALARYLVSRGDFVHLVGYRAEDELAADPAVRVNPVGKPGGSYFLGRRRLDRAGCAVAAAVAARYPQAHVVANGINCAWPDINWVHFVNHAWPARAGSGPLWLRAKSRLEASTTLRLERRILSRARLLIANSQGTRRDLIDHLAIPPERIVTVYPGLEPEWRPVTPEQRAAARIWLGLDPSRQVVVFAGALGHDPRKGFDTLWGAWRRLCASPGWTATLVVAGGGRALSGWRRTIDQAGLGDRVIVLGFTTRMLELFAAADLLVSPVRYEPYGMNVHEAISRGLPAIVSGCAGIAERYPASLRATLLADPNDDEELAARLRDWSANQAAIKERFEPLGRILRAHSANAMARAIVESVMASGTPKSGVSYPRPPLYNDVREGDRSDDGCDGR